MISPTHKNPQKFKDYQLLVNSVTKLAPAIRHILEKLTVLILPLPIFMLITGIAGIIEQQSPENLASLSSVGSGFFSFLEMHFLIIAGALGVTFIVWFLTRNIWSSSDDVSFENTSSEYENSQSVDEYEEFVDEELVHHEQRKRHSS